MKGEKIMELHDALDKVRQMAEFNPYDAFKEIERVLIVAVGLEETIKTLESKRSQIQNEVGDFERERSKLAPLVEELREALKGKSAALAAVNAQLAALKKNLG